METFMNGAMVIEGALFSFLLGLCMTWLGLHGLFRLMPATERSSSRSGLSLKGEKRIAKVMRRRFEGLVKRSKLQFPRQAGAKLGGERSKSCSR